MFKNIDTNVCEYTDINGVTYVMTLDECDYYRNILKANGHTVADADKVWYCVNKITGPLDSETHATVRVQKSTLA